MVNHVLKGRQIFPKSCQAKKDIHKIFSPIPKGEAGCIVACARVSKIEKKNLTKSSDLSVIIFFSICMYLKQSQFLEVDGAPPPPSSPATHSPLLRAQCMDRFQHMKAISFAGGN